MRTARIVGRLVRRSLKRPGAPPGTLVHTGERSPHDVRIHCMDYREGDFHEEELPPDRPLPATREGHVRWLNVDGLHDIATMERLGGELDLHPLVLEDVVSVGQRPKLEEYEDSLFIVVRMLLWDEERHQVDQEQMSLVVTSDCVVSFQEWPGDVLEPVRERLRQSRGRIRARGADYLAYAVLDAVVDGYFEVMEAMGNRIEELEEDVLDAPTRSTMHAIHHLRRELLVLRRAVWPLRELMGGLARVETPLLTPVTRTYLRDVYDHAVQIIDTVETLRDILSGLMDLYLNNVSHRTNEIMKVLTVIASIFIPLTFIAGVYGMNFEHMPELEYAWAYPAVLGLMLLLALGMLVYFKRRNWL